MDTVTNNNFAHYWLVNYKYFTQNRGKIAKIPRSSCVCSTLKDKFKQ